MSIIATYFLFVSALSGYRGSKYWPQGIACPTWLGKPWWGCGAAAVGTGLMVFAMGWTTGLLVSFCAFTAALSCILLAVACGSRVWRLSVVVFHVLGVVLCYLQF